MQEGLQPGHGDVFASDVEADGGGPAAGQQGDVAEQISGSTKGDGAGGGASAGPDAPTSGLYAAILALQQQVTRSRDRLLRATADLDNFRRRARRDLAQAVQQAEQQLVLLFLPIMDNLERAVSHAEESGVSDEATRSLLDGVKMVQKQFLATLAQHGIEPFESVGKMFDPEYHEALQQLESDAPPKTVLVEVQKGYLRNDRLVRPAMVVVSKGPPTGEGSRTEEEQSGAAAAAGPATEGASTNGDA